MLGLELIFRAASNTRDYLLISVLVLILSCFSVISYANTDDSTKDLDQTEEKKEFDAGDLIIGHVLDSYEWKIAEIGDTYIYIPLPVILYYEGCLHIFLSNKLQKGNNTYRGFGIAEDGPKKGRLVKMLDDGVTEDPEAGMLIDLSITKVVFSLFINAFLLCVIFISVGKAYKKRGSKLAPAGLQSFIEPIILFVRDDIAKSAIGEDKYQKFVPYLLTLFFFIFFNNLMGLIPFFPGGANVTGNISVTFTLAFFTFVATQFYANKGHWKHIFNTPGVPVFLKIPIPLMPIIELVGILIKPFVLMVRLFANITAGHMIIKGFLSLIFVLGSVATVMGLSISPVTVIFLIFMNFLELLVAFLQSYIFTFFSAIFFGMAVPDEHH